MNPTQVLFSTLSQSEAYTLEVAEAMPANQYDFKPEGAGWNFAELISHLAYGIEWWTENYVKGNSVNWNPPTDIAEKKELILELRKNYEGLRKSVSIREQNEKSIQGFHATLDHITHHRGQAVLYLRLNKIDPPEYRY